jgi:metallo-beta-lactamase family protein
MKGPAIILAGSGMCTGGRIIDHLQKGIDDPKNDILFVGYQAAGTPGRAIQRTANDPAAMSFSTESAKPSRPGFTPFPATPPTPTKRDWSIGSSMPESPGAVKLVHGETAARNALAEILEKRGYAVQ